MMRMMSNGQMVLPPDNESSVAARDVLAQSHTSDGYSDHNEGLSYSQPPGQPLVGATHAPAGYTSPGGTHSPAGYTSPGGTHPPAGYTSPGGTHAPAEYISPSSSSYSSPGTNPFFSDFVHPYANPGSSDAPPSYVSPYTSPGGSHTFSEYASSYTSPVGTEAPASYGAPSAYVSSPEDNVMSGYTDSYGANVSNTVGGNCVQPYASPPLTASGSHCTSTSGLMPASGLTGQQTFSDYSSGTSSPHVSYAASVDSDLPAAYVAQSASLQPVSYFTSVSTADMPNLSDGTLKDMVYNMSGNSFSFSCTIYIFFFCLWCFYEYWLEK